MHYAVPENHVTGLNSGHADHRAAGAHVGMRLVHELGAVERAVFVRNDTWEVRRRDICRPSQTVGVLRSRKHIPNFQLFLSQMSPCGSTRLKNGRRIRYELLSWTSG